MSGRSRPGALCIILDGLLVFLDLPLAGVRAFVVLELVDGGVADSIPVQAAADKGATRIMVLRSQLDGYVKKSFTESKLIPLLFRKYPELKKAMSQREFRYNDSVNFIKHPPKNVEIIEICPRVLRTGRTTRDQKILEADYAEGKRAGLEAIERWNKG